MVKYMIAFGLCLLSVSLSLCRADPSWAVNYLRAGREAEAEKLMTQLIRVEADLREKLPEQKGVEQNIRQAEELLNEPGWKCRFKTSSKKKALKQLVELKSLTCDLRSLELLERLNHALEKYRSSDDRIHRIFNHYRLKHADKCRSVYKLAYDNEMRSLDLKDPIQRDLKRLHWTLEGLNIFHFRYTFSRIDIHGLFRQQKQLIMMPNFKVQTDAANGLKHIVRQLSKQLKGTEQWNSLKSIYVEDAKLKQIFDDYLFNPCKQFRDRFGSVLQPALLFSTFEDANQGGFIANDQIFFRDIFNYGFCGKLIDEQRKLYAKFYQVWRKVTPSLLDAELV